MKIRLTEIALDHDGQHFAEGKVLEVGVDIPAEVAEARLLARRAELVLETEGGEIRPEFQAALARLTEIREAALAAGAALAALVESASDAEAIAALSATYFAEAAAEPVWWPQLEALGERGRAAKAQAEEAIKNTPRTPAPTAGSANPPPAKAGGGKAGGLAGAKPKAPKA